MHVSLSLQSPWVAYCLPAAGLHGASVFITGRRQDALDAAVTQLRAEGISATGLQGDVRQQDACDRCAGRCATGLQSGGLACKSLLLSSVFQVVYACAHAFQPDIMPGVRMAAHCEIPEPFLAA